MGLFDKKYCDVCGEKIGLLGNRKLEDGNLCKDCARKLSPFFSERRHSTVAEIKEQLAYREQNQAALSDFRPDLTFGEGEKVYIDTAAGKFIVSSAYDWRKANPDLISISQVAGVETDIRENKEELFYEDKDGNRKSYTPRRYECDYEFNVTIRINSPWFDQISLELSEGNRPDSVYTDGYRDYERQMHELENTLLGKRAEKPAPAPRAEEVPPAQNWFCPDCGTPNSGGKFCQNCGTPRPAAQNTPVRCSGCGWTPEPGQSKPKFCPECGKPM